MQQLAGHASSKTTMDIYTHVNMNIKRAAADVTEDVFSRQGEEEKAARRGAAKPAAQRGADNIIVFGYTIRRRHETSLVQTPGRFEPDSNHPNPLNLTGITETPADQQVS